MKNQIFLQARMGSTRLPRKVLSRICGKTIIELIVERLVRVKDIDRIILLTTTEKGDEELLEEAERLEMDCFRGCEENVLDRFYQASLKFKPDGIIRVTGDCPLIDPVLIDKGLDAFKESVYDVVSNVRTRTYPDGLDFEIFKSKALETAWQHNLQQFQGNKEAFEGAFINPTKYILESAKFKNWDLKNSEDLSHIRLTLDYQEDLELIKTIYENLYRQGAHLGLDEVLEFLRENPGIGDLNREYVCHDYGLKVEDNQSLIS